MFDCKVCAEKDKRIHDLISQVNRMERIYFPGQSAPSVLPTIDLDAVSGDTIPPSDSSTSPDTMTFAEIASEADRILTGNY